MAVVIVDRIPFIVRAYQDPRRIQGEVEERKAWLGRVQSLRLEPGDAARDSETESDNIVANCDDGALFYVARRLLEHAKIQSRGENVSIEYPEGARFWFRKRILEEARLL